MTSLYIHIPFCTGRCNYCSFNTYPGMEALYSRYVAALQAQIARMFTTINVEPLQTIFFGGGTPSVLSAEQVCDIIASCDKYFGIADDAEISVELNPRTVDLMKLLLFRQAGVNRISIGVQSFIDEELQVLGRLHSAQQGWDCVRDTLGAGFGNISIDLMYGIPGQSLSSWKWSLETAISLNPTHLSLYQLTIEENTPFHQMLDQGTIALPDEDEIIKMDRATSVLCHKAEMRQYEISNYAISGFECRHNLNYWHNRDYLAVGAGAVGFSGGERIKMLIDPLRYCEAVERDESIVEEKEKLSREASFRESVVIGLRMVKGVSYAALLNRFGINIREYYGHTLDSLLQEGVVEFTSTHFRLTRKGRPIANQILAELV